ncbi:DUF6378 domain-containing protein [Halomonas sp. V046]|uniref:DUF6378 domain-containing protein n=1 Tax=Halomonas sp. V046 TaxID=3459611 RepID=UPI004043FAD9
MKMTATDEKALDALVSQHAESRAPVQTMIVQAACNARASTDRDRVRAALSRLKGASYVVRTTGDRWVPTQSGIARATGIEVVADEASAEGQQVAEQVAAVSADAQDSDGPQGDSTDSSEVVTISAVCADRGFVKVDVPASTRGIRLSDECRAGAVGTPPASEPTPHESERPLAVNGIQSGGRASNDAHGESSEAVTAQSILSRAGAHMRDRAATYDKPQGERSIGATVGAFEAITGLSLTEEQGWLFMALLKAVRSQQGGYRADSYEDGAAYFALAGEAAGRDRQ